MAEFDQRAASRAVLIEVTNVLGASREHLVLVGGWVPELLFPNRGHIGSLDVDLAGAAHPVKVDLICGQYAHGEKTGAIQINELQTTSATPQHCHGELKAARDGGRDPV